MEFIKSAKNQHARRLRSLADKKCREAEGLILVEGEKLIRDALACGLRLECALAEEQKAHLLRELNYLAPAYLATREVIESVCDTKTPQGICAAFSMPLPLPIDRLPDKLVALDGVQDPGNVGAIWRTADAAGFNAMLVSGDCADVMSPKVMRSAMGSGFRLPYAHCEPLSDTLDILRGRGYAVIASALDGADIYSAKLPKDKFALVIGSEARGISPGVRACADVIVKLPMRGGAESLNAAVAAGIMMYELTR